MTAAAPPVCQPNADFACRYQDETSQQRILYKGTFGTLCPGGLLPNLLQIAPRNVANTGLLTWGGKCLALFEAGQPHSLDAATLQTDGISLLGGTIKAGAPFSTGWTFTDWLAGRLSVDAQACDGISRGQALYRSMDYAK